MPDIWMDVDAAVTVPCNILPLIDDTDFKSIEDASVAYNATGMELYFNFISTAGVQVCVPLSPTSGGAYDWTHVDGGMYKIELPASGGGDWNNDEEGFGWITGVADGVLPFRGPVIGFRDAGLNNALIDSPYIATRGLAGTALPNAAADAPGGLPISDAGALDLDFLSATLAILLSGLVLGTVDTGSFSSTSTEFESDDIEEATADHYNGRVIVFTSGILAGQACEITDYALAGANGHFTVTALTEAPGNNDTFTIF